jgi:dihydroflavonol-4-reductase
MDVKGTRIAVTGATGFLGSQIALDLLSQGASVRGVVRSPEKGDWLKEKGVDFAKADLMDRDALEKAFDGVDAIVSNAALFTVQRKSWDAFYRPNKTGTENVYHAAHAAGVKRMIQISTIGVYKPKMFGMMNEDSPKLTLKDRRLHWNYAVTKSLSENIAWDLAHQFDQQITVIRPGPIYGPRDRNMIPVFQRLMRWPVMLAPTFGIPAVHVGDVSAAVVSALGNEESIGKAYNTAGEPVSIREFMRTWKDVTGAGPPLIPMWLPLKLQVDCSAAKRELQFSNRTLREGLQDALKS